MIMKTQFSSIRRFGTSLFRMRFWQTCFLLASLAGVLLAATNDGIGPPPGQLLASQCFQCHGTDGQAVSGFEPIVGRSANDMYGLLLEMSQRRPENIMDMQVRAFTPEQLGLIATYLSTLPVADAEF